MVIFVLDAQIMMHPKSLFYCESVPEVPLVDI